MIKLGVCARIALICFGLGISLADPSLARDEARGSDLETFVSRVGGFRMGKPAAWHVQERPTADLLYEAYISREPLDGPGARFVVGVTVMRARDNRSIFGFTTRKPALMADQFAEGLAGLMGEPNEVTAMPARLEKNLFEFRIRAGSGDDCRDLWLVTGPDTTEWFHALWEAPCDEAREHDLLDLMRDMAGSLKLERKWGEQ